MERQLKHVIDCSIQMEPQIIVANYPITSPNVAYYPLILSFYIFCEELQDIVVGGWREYFVRSGMFVVWDSE